MRPWEQKGEGRRDSHRGHGDKGTGGQRPEKGGSEDMLSREAWSPKRGGAGPEGSRPRAHSPGLCHTHHLPPPIHTVMTGGSVT